MEDMPVLHVFVVAPVAECDQMVPRTYDTLTNRGQHGGMKGQQEMIEKEVAKGSTMDVVVRANGIEKPTVKQLEAEGLRVVASMLQVSGNCRDLKGKNADALPGNLHSASRHWLGARCPGPNHVALARQAGHDGRQARGSPGLRQNTRYVAVNQPWQQA